MSLHHNGNGSFQTEVTYSTGYQSAPMCVVIADFNNDRQPDIAAANYLTHNIGILLGYGNGSFDTVRLYSSGEGSFLRWLSIGYFNNDRGLDIAVVNFGTNTIVVLFGFGDRTFLLSTSYSTSMGSLPLSLTVGDFNNDRRLDIVVTNYESNNIGMFLGYDQEIFTGVVKYNTGKQSQSHSVAVSDLNNDGYLDIIVTNYGTHNVAILLGYGNGIVGPVIPFQMEVNSAPYSRAIADFNNDNKSDMFVTNSQTNNVAILLGYGNTTFTIVATYTTGDSFRLYTVAVDDFDNDNILDIVIDNSATNTIIIFYGFRNGTFGNQMSYLLDDEYRPYSVAVTDLNQDNLMNIVIACYDTDNIAILAKMC